MSGRWIKRKRARSEWGRELAKRRWAKHRAEVDRKLREGEIPEPPKEWPLDEPYFEIVVTHRPTGRVHRFALYRPARGRRDQYRITHNGREWKAAMGLTRFFRGLQAAMFGRSGAGAERATLPTAGAKGPGSDAGSASAP